MQANKYTGVTVGVDLFGRSDKIFAIQNLELLDFAIQNLELRTRSSWETLL